MACSLVARGRCFDVREFVSEARFSISEDAVWERGSPFLRGKPEHEDSGFTTWITRDKDAWDNLDADIADVVAFLTGYRESLGQLVKAHGVDDVMLDFAIMSRAGTGGVFMQGEYLPPELLRLAGELNIGIALSLYPPLEPNGNYSDDRRNDDESEESDV